VAIKFSNDIIYVVMTLTVINVPRQDLYGFDNAERKSTRRTQFVKV